MVKGIKKIIWDGKDSSATLANLTIPNKLLVINPNKMAWCKVESWYAGTTDAEKKKEITWMFQNQDKTIIILQKKTGSNDLYGVELPKNLCGSYTYFLDASTAGKSNKNDDVGLYIRGNCKPLVVSSKWCITNDGADVRKTKVFSYGHIVHLNLETEGLNGDILTIEVYSIKFGDDNLFQTYTNVKVIDGEVNLTIQNTSTWKGKVKNIADVEEFYIYVKHQTTGKYILNANKDKAHAKFLRIKNELVANAPSPPVNNTAAKVGITNIKPDKYAPCKYETITILETEKKDGKINKIDTIVFENGNSIKDIITKKETITKTIHFDFNETTIDGEETKKLTNVLGFLLEHTYATITLHGYACVIGKENYNMDLSQKRSDTIKKFLVDGKLDTNRIISKGKGEISPTDDKDQGDDIKYKNEEKNVNARRVDIMFDYWGHDASSIIYETIAPSSNKNITIDVKNYETKACFREKNKHTKKIKITSPQQITIEKAVTQLEFPIHSNLSNLNPAPLNYIWPKLNLLNGIKGKSIDSANYYYAHVHSCRYFSNGDHATVIVKAYPDIKWELAFELKIDLKSYSHTNMPSEFQIFEKHQKIATKEGYKRWKLNKDGEVPITVGIGLKAEWDEAQRKVSLTKEWEKKTEVLAKTLSKTIELVQKGINVCRGVMEKTSIPVTFQIEYPKIEAVGAWYLKKEQGFKEVAVVGEISFGAKPFIGAKVTIDLIAAAVSAASYATTGSPAISNIVNQVRKAGKKVGAEIAANAEFYGNIGIMFKDLKLNSIKGLEGGFLMVDGKMGMKLIIEIKAGNKPWHSKKKPLIEFSALARATGDAYFGGEVKIEQDNNGITLEPTLKFSGLEVKLEAEVTIGWFKESFEKKYDEVVPKKEIKFGKTYLN